MNVSTKDDKASVPSTDGGRSGVRTIQRNSRLSQPVHLPFFAILGSQSFEGRDLTLDEFEVYGDPQRLSTAERHALDPGSISDVKLRIELFGFVCEIDAEVEVVSQSGEGPEATIRFAFREMSRQGREALRRIARSYHAGYVASPSDLLENHDPQTLTGTAGAAAGGANQPRRWRSLLGLGLSMGVILGTFGFIGAAAYERFFLITARFATVTAPEVEMISAEMGQVRTTIQSVGQQVGRDTPLYTVNSAELRAEEAALGSRIAFLNDMIASMAAGATPASLSAGTGGEMLASPEDARRALGLAEGELRALQLRLSAMEGYSPCDCVVSWFQEDGAWVVPGDTVAVLARTAETTLRVEALVHVADMDGMFVGQSAVVTDVSTGEGIEAVVERITLDPRQQPRVGFPDWLRREPTLASVIVSVDRPLDPAQIGQPFEVAIRRPGPATWIGDAPSWVARLTAAW